MIEKIIIKDKASYSSEGCSIEPEKVNFLGGYNLDNLANKFDGNEKLLVCSLISWSHSGSHGPMDDDHYHFDEATIEKQINVFKKIFDKMGHIEHYNMMRNGGS